MLLWARRGPDFLEPSFVSVVWDFFTGPPDDAGGSPGRFFADVGAGLGLVSGGVLETLDRDGLGARDEGSLVLEREAFADSAGSLSAPGDGALCKNPSGFSENLSNMC